MYTLFFIFEVHDVKDVLGRMSIMSETQFLIFFPYTEVDIQKQIEYSIHLYQVSGFILYFLEVILPYLKLALLSSLLKQTLQNVST